ncbi:MAG TPA: hypothetical protein VFZ25_21255, partial [Chloroflexota bacterium]|nr:hypothetical protein [Chloroflexota bacterium]
RLYRFLGRVKPVAENGYEVVVASAEGADRLARLAHDAGLTDFTLVTPTDALVSRWLVETAGHQGERGLVVAVAVGDDTTLVAGYEVGDDARGLPRVVRGPRRGLSAGYGVWAPIFAERIRERLVEVADITHDPALFDSIVEFGAKLRAAPGGKSVEWSGPWPERLYEPVRVTREECEAWDAVRNWMNRVRGLVGDFALSGGAHAISRILLGGIGGVWPFAADAVGRWGPVWQSGAPWLDLAAGAAWWSEASDCFAATTATPPRVEAPRLPEPVPPFEAPPPFIPETIPDEIVAPADDAAVVPSLDDVPPWERDE